MKLYTEEQVMKAIRETRYYSDLIKPDNVILKELTSIELPSDEEMANASNHCKDGQVKIGFLRGVLWMKEQIFNKK